MSLERADARADLALTWLDQGRHEDAITTLSELVARHPDIDRYAYRLACAYGQAGRDDLALVHYVRAVELNPAYPIFHHGLLRCLAAHADFETTLSTYARWGGLAAFGSDIQAFFALTFWSKGTQWGGTPDRVLREVPGLFGPYLAAIELIGETPDLHGVVLVEKRGTRLHLFAPPSVIGSWINAERLLTMRPYLAQLARSDVPDGVVRLCLGDLPPASAQPTLCFSSPVTDDLLIPDSLFLHTDGYQAWRQTVAQQGKPWLQRHDQAYWRGALTGLAANLEQVLDLPRVQLCRFAQTCPDLDARLTSAHQFQGLMPDLVPSLEAQGLMAPREDERVNLDYRYMIDLDGNSNSWPGLFIKLLSGAPTIKLISPCRQWYYDRLVAMQHVFPISAIDPDLPDAVAWLRSHPEMAQTLASQAAQLAGGMNARSEYPVFEAAFRRALAR